MIVITRTVAEPLLTQLLDAFPPERPYARDAFTRDPMPDVVAHHLDHRLQERLARDVEALRQARPSAWFDDEHPRVRQARQAWLDALREHAQIPAEAWETTLRQAVRQVTAYLAEPRRTLLESIFEDDQPLPVATVLGQMAFFAAYPYLHEQVAAHVQRQDLDAFTPDHFEELLRRIDRETTADYDAEQWVDLLRPLYAIVHQARPEERGVPVPLLGAFFSEKGHRRAVRLLRQRHEQQEVDVLGAEALRRLLSENEHVPVASTVRSAPLPDAEPEAPTRQAMARLPDTEKEAAPFGEEPAPAAEAQGDAAASAQPEPPSQPERSIQASSGPPDEPVPLWKQFQQGIQRQPATGERVVQRRGFHSTPDIDRQEETKGEENEEEAPPHAVPRWMQFQSGEDDDEDEMGSLDVLERSVLGPSGPRNRDLFLDELFDGDVEDYAHTLQRLLGAPTWSDASQIIAEEVFRKHQVNIYSDPAVLFTDAAELRYRR